MQDVAARQSRPPPAANAELANKQPIEELEFEWDSEIWESPRREKRESMPTLPDHDPLRHDLRYDFNHDATRDSLPTLTDLDPLRHDSEIPKWDERGATSGYRKLT